MEPQFLCGMRLNRVLHPPISIFNHPHRLRKGTKRGRWRRQGWVTVATMSVFGLGLPTRDQLIKIQDNISIQKKQLKSPPLMGGVLYHIRIITAQKVYVLQQGKSPKRISGKSSTRNFNYNQDLRRQTPQTGFIVDIYVLKTMIYCRNRFFCVSPESIQE